MDVGAKKVSTAYSATVKSDKTNFQTKTKTTTVDRTSGTGRLGNLQSTRGTSKRAAMQSTLAELNCENFNSARLRTEVDNYDGCNGVFGPSQRQCKSVVVAVWAQFLCPEYGVAFSGFCQPLADQVTAACVNAGCGATWPWDVFFPSFNIIRQVDDAFCVHDIVNAPVISGIQEAAVGFFLATNEPVPKSAITGTFIRTSSSVHTVADVEGVFFDPSLQNGITSQLYEAALFQGFCAGRKRDVSDESLGVKPPGGPPVEQLQPYGTPFSDVISGGETIVFKLNGLVNIPADGSVYIYFDTPLDAEFRINGTVIPPGCFQKRDGQNCGYNTVGLAAGWVPFEFLGYITSGCNAYISISFANQIIGSIPDGYQVRTYSDQDPIPALYTLSFPCCQGGR